MMTPFMGNNPDLMRVRWCADTGCFSQPEKHNNERYLDWLDKKPRRTNVFATAPDVVCDAEATWERSKGMLPQIRELGFDAALVAQNGIEHMNIRWDSFDALFIGGDDAWKLGPVAYEVGLEAKRRGKHLHWGRVNSLKRLFMARKAHADSADGTYIAFAPDLLLPRVCRWLDKVNAQGVFGLNRYVRPPSNQSMTSFRIDKEDYARLAALSLKREKTVSELIREAVQYWLRQQDA